jgi:3-oxoacyl-[acyl-carrier-protein] synthase-3
MIKSKILSTGSYLPEKILSNEDISKIVDTNDDWIFSRVGIKNRHIIAPDQNTSDMALEASLAAINSADIDKNSIDLIILSTTTPDKTFPATAAILHHKLRINKPIPCFDIQAVCSGFVYALSVADAMIKSGGYKNALVIGADCLSRITDWTDRATCVLFGDGAGAVILSSTGEEEGIINSYISCDGRLEDILYTTGGTSTTRSAGVMTMNGKEVYKKAVTVMSEAVLKVFDNSNYSIKDLDYLIPHQANIRIMQKVGEILNLSSNQVISTIENYGNNSAATIPLALDSAIKNNIIKKGNLIATTSAGGGFTWGANLIRI